MKIYILFLILFLSSLTIVTQCNGSEEYIIKGITKKNKTNKKNKETIKFDHLSHDFGEVKKGRVVTHTFTFTNIGDKPIIINDVMPSCGCTTPKYTKIPVQPKQKGSVDVSFNSSYFIGNIYKNVTIVGNFETKIIDFKAIIK